MLVLAPMTINKVDVEPISTWIEVKQNDYILFPGDDKKPYLYHIELIIEETCLNFNVLKPLIARCEPRMQNYMKIIENSSDLETPLKCNQLCVLKRYLLNFGYGRWSKIRAVSS